MDAPVAPVGRPVAGPLASIGPDAELTSPGAPLPGLIESAGIPQRAADLSPAREVPDDRTGSTRGMADDVELTLVTDVGTQGDDLVEGLVGSAHMAARQLSHRQVNPALARSCFVRVPPFPVLCPGG